MARTRQALLDWQLFSRAARVDGNPPIWSRFALELAPNFIVSPHLFDWVREGPYEPDAYTCSKTPVLIVFCGRGEHLAFLRDELVPAAMRHARHVALIDADQREFAVDAKSAWSPLAELAPLLRAAYGAEPSSHAAARFDELLAALSGHVDGVERRLVQDQVVPGHVERVEQHPLRLWEALFWRGHTYRYELIDGEVPLVGNLLTPLGANRTLMQLVDDARRLESCAPHDEHGWIRCGRFRMRQQGHFVHVRVRLDPADARAAFMPRARVQNDDVLPSLVGALMAGGDNGKTELWNGWTWSAVVTDSSETVGALVPKLQREIQEWVGSPASIQNAEFSLPNESRDEWFLVPYERWVTIYVPFFRERCLPWDVHAEDYWYPPTGAASSG
jgi:hypothetical protein